VPHLSASEVMIHEEALYQVTYLYLHLTDKEGRQTFRSTDWQFGSVVTHWDFLNKVVLH